VAHERYKLYRQASMKDLRIEITDKGTALYLAVDPDGVWAKTTRPDDLVTIDWDAQGRVIGVEAIGSAARNAISACVAALKQLPAEDPDALHSALDAVTGTTADEPVYLEPDFAELLTSVDPEALHVAIEGIVSKDCALEPSFGNFKILALNYSPVAFGSDPTPRIFGAERSDSDSQRAVDKPARLKHQS